MKISKRTSQRLFRLAVDEFIRLLSQVQKRKVNYRCNDVDTVAWDRWVEIFEGRNYIIGEDFVKTFVAWGVQTWMNSDSNKDNRYNYSMRLSWIFGNGGIKRWDANKISENKRFIRESLKQENSIVSHRFSRLGKIVLLIRPLEEHHRQRFYNTKRGLAWCVSNTYLYYHRSPLCSSCNYKDECKEILKENFPKIYKIRGYDN